MPSFSSCASGYNVTMSSLVQGADGNFDGVTPAAGKRTTPCNGYGCGTVFKITPGGALTTLVYFGETNGSNPTGPLVQRAEGNFVGATSQGGNGYGTIFTITPDGTLATLHSFDDDDGERSRCTVKVHSGGACQIRSQNFNIFSHRLRARPYLHKRCKSYREAEQGAIVTAPA